MSNPVASQKLMEAAVRLSIASTIQDISAIVTETARALVGSDGATFVLKENDLCYYYDENAISSLWKGKKFPMSACISGWAMINKKSATIPDIYRDDRIPHDAYKPTFVKSLCMVPIRRDSPIGAMGSYWKNITHPEFEEVELLQMLADIASNDKIQPKVIDFKAMTKEIVEHILIQYPGKQVSIEIETDLVAIGDPILLRIALENLISNSFKFSQENIALKIKVGKSKSEGQYSTFYLSDNGIGLDTSEVTKLFKPLSRLHDEKKYPGIGLGLYSVSQIIKLHGGEVKAEGKVKEGATFYFSLPSKVKA